MHVSAVVGMCEIDLLVLGLPLSRPQPELMIGRFRNGERDERMSVNSPAERGASHSAPVAYALGDARGVSAQPSKEQGASPTMSGSGHSSPTRSPSMGLPAWTSAICFIATKNAWKTGTAAAHFRTPGGRREVARQTAGETQAAVACKKERGMEKRRRHEPRHAPSGPETRCRQRPPPPTPARARGRPSRGEESARAREHGGEQGRTTRPSASGHGPATALACHTHVAEDLIGELRLAEELHCVSRIDQLGAVRRLRTGGWGRMKREGGRGREEEQWRAPSEKSVAWRQAEPCALQLRRGATGRLSGVMPQCRGAGRGKEAGGRRSTTQGAGRRDRSRGGG